MTFKTKQLPTNITPEIKEAFEAVTSGEFRKSIALFSCFLDGKPTAAIVSIVKTPDGGGRITPLFVWVTDDMNLTDHEGKEPKP